MKVNTDDSEKGASGTSQNGEVQVPLVTSQESEATKPKIVPITQENRGEVSETYKGLIINPDGSFTMTPQHLTWLKNSEMQIAKYHSSPREFPLGIKREGHAKASMLDLKFSYPGEWAKIPLDRMDKGPNYTKYDIVRIERYVDEEGNIRKAVCYATKEEDFKTWFKFDNKVFFPQFCQYFLLVLP